MKDLFIEYKDYLMKKKTIKDNTKKYYLHDTMLFLNYLDEISIVECDRLTKPVVYRYVLHLQKKDKSVATINRNIISIRKFCDYLMENGLLTNDPTIGVEVNHEYIKEEITILSRSEYQTLLNLADRNPKFGRRDKLIFRFMGQLGVKVTELINISINDVSLKDKTVKIAPKTVNYRLLDFDKDIYNDLKLYFFYLGISVDEGPDLPLFFNKYKNSISRQGIWKIIKKYANAPELNINISPHTFRHTAAVSMIEKGMSSREIKNVLGHENNHIIKKYKEIASRDIILEHGIDFSKIRE